MRWLMILCLVSVSHADEKLDFFESKIRPVLIEKCYQCHSTSGEKIKGGLLLDHRDGLLKGGDSGPAIVPGDVEGSLLIEAIRYSDPDYEMPPKEKLSDAVVQDFEKWIAMGAADPREKPDDIEVKNVLYDQAAADSHWAFQPRKEAVPPEIEDDWVHNPIDAFILDQLNKAGLKPSPRADGQILLRRLTYAVTGLPPTAEQVADWNGGENVEAFIDGLLHSPQYGVHLGRKWLDVARYSDQSGLRLAPSAPAPYYPHAWTYRDWVIAAFNKDLPYDQFILHQIAGDAFATEDNPMPSAGLGFLRVGKSFGQNMNDRIDDRIDVLSKGFLGLTASCARCHDHKFDPIPTRDYYALHGILNSAEEIDILLEETAGTPDGDRFIAERDNMIAAAEEECLQFLKDFCDEHITTRLGDYLLGSLKWERGELRESESKLAARELNLQPALFEEWSKGMVRLREKDHPLIRPWYHFVETGETGVIENPVLKAAVQKADPQSASELADVYAAVISEVASKANGIYPIAAFIAHNTSIQRNWQKHIPSDPHLPPALENESWEEIRQVFMGFEGPWGGAGSNPRALLMAGCNDAHGRYKSVLQKAVKLAGTHPGAPVMAMGFRDVEKPENSPVFIRGDAGNPGEVAPRQFFSVLSKGDAKPYVKGSGRVELARDIASPDNPLTARIIVNRVWHWHFGKGLVGSPSDFGLQTPPPSHPGLLDWLANRFVENGWSIRELNRLILNSATWQQSSFPRDDGMKRDPGNKLIWRMNPRRLTWEELRDSILQASGSLVHRSGGRPVEDEGDATTRTAFIYVNRYDLSYDAQTFDFANPDATVATRESSTIPQQALFFLNDPWLEVRASGLADLAQQNSDDRNSRIEFLWERVYQRSPTPAEAKSSRHFLESHSMQRLAHSLLSTNEFVFVR